MFTPTRAAGLEVLADFVPRAGRDYARDRNRDAGVLRENVSTLSPYLRHRMLTEREVVGAVLGRHSLASSEKFVQEVFWRTYWKGWLERHPEIWRRYRRDLADLDRTAEYEAAVTGRTGIDAMDAWARELIETGYLHNHTRMWFASIWIFTLGLPWQLGADFFYRNLLDGDAASNTLSWRWVAGLQTKGKTYLATTENISRYTEGRFAPAGLATVARPLTEEPVATEEISAQPESPTDGRTGLLLHEEDLNPESLGAEHPFLARVVAVAGGADAASRSPSEVGENVHRFTAGALDDAVERASTAFEPDVTRVGTQLSEVLEWASSEALDTVVVPYAPVGPVHERMMALEPALASESVTLVAVRRDWDRLAWPHATRGFFPFREKIPGLVRQQKLVSGW